MRVSLRPLRDRIGTDVRLLFVGINPGVRSALTGHHFAGYSNRFWSLLFESGLVSERLTYEDDDRLPRFQYGITNLVSRPTPGVGDIAPEEFVAGRRRVWAKVRRHQPAVVALVGVTVFRAMFPDRRGRVSLGLQPERIAGSDVFVLPNPSGRNAHVSQGEMRAAFAALARHLGIRRRHTKGGSVLAPD
ncbi:MAG: mismatch-specific DNA-glycosylase [Vicinamibacterales bacterium]